MQKNAESLIRLFTSLRMKPLQALLLSAGATTLVFILDFATPPELSFSLFYLFPLAIGMLFCDRWLGWANALFCTLAWMVAFLLSPQRSSSAFYLVWTFMVRIATNAIFAYLLDVLRQVIEGLHELSLIDPLTGAANRRFFEGYLSRTIDRAIRTKEALTLLALDFDDFKELNDRYGHDRGDEALMGLVRAIQGKIRPDDMLCRLGGDEFVLVLYGMDYDRSEEVMARLRQAIREEHAARGIESTQSIGAITFLSMDEGAEAMMKKADELLYEVKREGKNTIKHSLRP